MNSNSQFSRAESPDNYENLLRETVADAWEGDAFFEHAADGVRWQPLIKNQWFMMPMGVIIPYFGEEIPSWALKCEGQELSRDTHRDLFNVIGTRFGAGNGTTTFNLPNISSSIPKIHYLIRG